MNLKQLESKEDEKQFKLLYYHFLVKYQFSSQPYCEAAGFQILTVLACAPKERKCLGLESRNICSDLSRPAAESTGVEGVPLQVALRQAGDGDALPTEELVYGGGCFSLRPHSLNVGQECRREIINVL